MRQTPALRRAIAMMLIGIQLASCGVVARGIRESTTGIATPGPRRAEWGKAAWQYFRSTRNGSTGLTETNAGAGFTTVDTIADHLAAAVAARRLGLIEAREFDEHVSQIIQFLNTAPLSDGKLPGRYYNTSNGKLMDPPQVGVDPGWSAVGIGRLLTWLRIVADRYPRFAPYVQRAVARWRTCEAVGSNGRLLHALPGESGLRTSPVTGDAYAIYGAQGFAAWGQRVSLPDQPPSETTIDVSGVTFPLAAAAQSVPVMTAPYALMQVEFGWDGPNVTLSAEREASKKLVRAQARRTAETAIPTARSDYRRTSEPYEVIDTVLNAGYPWSTTNRAGKAHPELALTSTRAAFGLWALDGRQDDDTTLKAVASLFAPDSGWYEGRYEAGGGYEWTRTSTTNAFVLEAILFRENGPLYRAPNPLPAFAPAPNQNLDCALPLLRGR